MADTPFGNLMLRWLRLPVRHRNWEKEERFRDALFAGDYNLAEQIYYEVVDEAEGEQLQDERNIEFQARLEANDQEFERRRRREREEENDRHERYVRARLEDPDMSDDDLPPQPLELEVD